MVNRSSKIERRKNIVIVILSIILMVMLIYIATDKATSKIKNQNNKADNNAKTNEQKQNKKIDSNTKNNNNDVNDEEDVKNVNRDYCKAYDPDDTNSEYEYCNYNKIDDSVNVEDTYAIDLKNYRLYLLNSGKLYVKDLSSLERSSESGPMDYIYVTEDTFISSKELMLVENAPENIKRIKTINTISPNNELSLLLITEYGEVWSYTMDDENSGFSKLVSSINKYEIDDIIYYYSENGCDEKVYDEKEGCGNSFKIITKNGKIIEKNNFKAVQ